MLDFTTQSQIVDATASIMRAYLKAATNTFAASASHSLSLWSGLLETGSPLTAVAGWPRPPSNAVAMSWAPLAQAWWLGPSVTFWAPLADWGAWSRASFAASGDHNGATQPPASGALCHAAPQRQPASEAGFASYRSAGGHAAAQVIVPALQIAGITATAALSPMQTILGVWRAALGASSRIASD